MKTLILSCLAAVSLFSFVGCADSERHDETSYQSSSMSTDSKDMHHRH